MRILYERGKEISKKLIKGIKRKLEEMKMKNMVREGFKKGERRRGDVFKQRERMLCLC